MRQSARGSDEPDTQPNERWYLKGIGLVLVATCTWVLGDASARADIPTTDAAQLTQHSQTAATTVKLVPVTTQRQDAHNGVKCAVTTGKKANVTNPTVQPQAGAGAQAIQSYAPDMTAAPSGGATGAALNSQTLFNSSGDVVGGVAASQSTMSAAQSTFKTSGQQVGTTPTIMASFDVNSAARLQNNLSWNTTMGSANLWVTALNALNLALNSDMSRAATGMRGTVTASTGLSPVCSSGTVTTGSSLATAAGAPASPACTAAQLFGAGANVIQLLTQVQAAANAGPSLASPLSVSDVNAALAAIQANAR